MQRNMENIIKETQIKYCYSMTYDEMIRLGKMGIFNAIDDAFKFGYAIGQRALKNEMKKGEVL